MKKAYILIVLLIVFLGGCDDGLRIVDMEITQYPDTIVYIVGEKDELDFTGMEIVYILKDGTKSYKDVYSTGALYNDYFEVIHQIDFETPGVYTVTFRRAGIECTFAIQVIDIDDYLIEK